MCPFEKHTTIILLSLQHTRNMTVDCVIRHSTGGRAWLRKYSYLRFRTLGRKCLGKRQTNFTSVDLGFPNAVLGTCVAFAPRQLDGLKNEKSSRFVSDKLLRALCVRQRTNEKPETRFNLPMRTKLAPKKHSPFLRGGPAESSSFFWQIAIECYVKRPS